MLAVLLFTAILAGCDTPTNEKPKTDTVNTNVSGNGNTNQSSNSSSNTSNSSSNPGSAPTVQELTGLWQMNNEKSKIYYYYDGRTGYIAFGDNDASLNSGGTFTYANGTLTVSGAGEPVTLVKKDASTIRIEAGVDTIELTKLPNPSAELITKIKTAPPPNP